MRSAMILASMTLLAVLDVAGTTAAPVTQRRGAFAFHYAPVLSEERLEWYSKFELLVTHDPLPLEQVRRLHAAGTRVLFYEWSVAFYESRATAWQRSLLNGSRRRLLHRKALRGGVGSDSAPAWYFDPAAKGLMQERAGDLLRRLRETEYDGIFFDTTGFESVHPAARKEYARRHPATEYDAAFSALFVALRAQRPDVVLFTNQGYRNAGHYLPFVDWDLTESLITAPSAHGFSLRKWEDAEAPWSSIAFVLRTMIEPLQRRYPRVRFANLNYTDGSPETVRTAAAIALLFDSDSFVSAEDLVVERDPVYFFDPGPPLGPRVEWKNGSGAHRFFEHGLVVVSASAESVTLEVPRKGLRDLFTGDVSCGPSLTVPPSGDGIAAHFFELTSDCDGDVRSDSVPRR